MRNIADTLSLSRVAHKQIHSKSTMVRKEGNSHGVVFIGTLLVLLLATEAVMAVTFQVKNLASSTPGGKRFNAAVGSSKASAMLQSALDFINRSLYPNQSTPRKPFTTVILTVDPDRDGSFVAYTVGGGNNTAYIHLSDAYVGGYPGTSADVAREVEGIIYHESTHVWQWDGRGTAPSGLIEGIADYIRLTAKLAPSHWVKPGAGDRWDQGYAVTAYFLQYCEGLRPGFVRAVNAKLAVSTWSLDYFPQLLGKTVNQLWAGYKAKYANA